MKASDSVKLVGPEITLADHFWTLLGNFWSPVLQKVVIKTFLLESIEYGKTNENTYSFRYLLLTGHYVLYLPKSYIFNSLVIHQNVNGLVQIIASNTLFILVYPVKLSK